MHRISILVGLADAFDTMESSGMNGANKWVSRQVQQNLVPLPWSRRTLY